MDVKNWLGGDETIAIVDYHSGARRITAQLLRLLGYNTIEISSCTAAREQIERRSDIDLLLADYSTLTEDEAGASFGDWLQQRFNNRVPLLISINTCSTSAIDWQGKTYVGVEKPYKIATLDRQVRYVLEDYRQDRTAPQRRRGGPLPERGADVSE